MRRRDFLSVIVGATVWPLAARARQSAIPVVGFLHAATAEANAHNVAAFRRGLAEAGYVEGKNVTIEYHFTNFRPELMPEAVGDLVRRNVSVIFAAEPAGVAVLSKIRTSIPLVALDLESDPLAKGYVKSLARPGGNMTGMFLDLPELSGKQVELLKEIVPRRSRIAIFGVPELTRRNLQRRKRQCGRSRSKPKLWKCGSPMTLSKPWRPPGRGRLKPVSCCRPHSYSPVRSKSARWRWSNGSLSFPPSCRS
jgi:ABC-type uncharacterized transport system substrate-binding protein